jgi:Thioredoxin reductase
MGTGARRTVETPAVFSMIGALPCTGWLPAEIERDDKGFIHHRRKSGTISAWQKMNRAPGPMETSRPGVFAAGDVRSGSVKRCAAAVGEGGMAVTNVHRALAEYRTR